MLFRSVALVLYTYQLLVTVAAAALGRERLTRRRIAALGAASITSPKALKGLLLNVVGCGSARSGFIPNEANQPIAGIPPRRRVRSPRWR